MYHFLYGKQTRHCGLYFILFSYLEAANQKRKGCDKGKIRNRLWWYFCNAKSFVYTGIYGRDCNFNKHICHFSLYFSYFVWYETDLAHFSKQSSMHYYVRTAQFKNRDGGIWKRFVHVFVEWVVFRQYIKSAIYSYHIRT